MTSPTSDPLSIRQLAVFVALVDAGSFTKAASSLGLGQSTVSGHVADLEKRLGTRVVERGRGTIRLTAAGEALLPGAREALEAERAARMAVEEVQGLISGRLVVGGSTIPSAYLLPALLAQFHQRYPAIALQLTTADSRGVLDRLAAFDVDVAVVGVEPPSADFESEKIGEDRLALVVAPEHPFATRESVEVSEVLGQPMVLRPAGSGTREAALEALARTAGQADLGALDLICELDSTEAVKAAVREGIGVSLVSALAVRDDVAAGRLASPRLARYDVRRAFYVATRRRGRLSPAARAFREMTGSMS